MAFVKYSKEEKKEFAARMKEKELVDGMDDGSPNVKRESQAFRDKIAADRKRLGLD